MVGWFINHRLEQVEYRECNRMDEVIDLPDRFVSDGVFLDEGTEYIETRLTKALKADHVLFLYDANIRPVDVVENGGLFNEALQEQKALICNDVENDPRYEPIVDNPDDLELHALLIYPLIDHGSVVGLVMAWGLKGRERIIEEMVPLRSGGEAIGVTVKKRKKRIPPTTFGEEQTAYLDRVMPRLLEKLKRDQTSEDSEVELSLEIEKNTGDTEDGVKSQNDKKHHGILEKMKSLFGLNR